MTHLPITKGGLDYLAISNSGVLVGDEATNAGRDRAFVWDQPHGVRDPNDLVPSNLGAELRQAWAVNVQGQIAANGYDGSNWHAYLLSDNNNDGDFKDANEVTDLGRLRGATGAAANAINDVGQVAGESGGNAFRWQNGVMKSLGQFNGQSADARGINHDGYVVGRSINGAWVWTGSGKIKGLSDLIPGNSGWYLGLAYGINDAGKIVGSGTPPSGVWHAFLLTPTSSSATVVTAAAPSLTDAKTPNLAPVEAGARSPHSLTVALPSSPGPQDSPILIPLTPVSDQDLTLLATELIRSGSKRPRRLFRA
jgi:probable HAF family extracellular repeat protein